MKFLTQPEKKSLHSIREHFLKREMIPYSVGNVEISPDTSRNQKSQIFQFEND